jgi:hypothetical protein
VRPTDKLAALPRKRVGAVLDNRAPRRWHPHGSDFPVNVSKLGLNGKGRARLDDVALGAAGEHVGEVVPRARLAKQQHNPWSVPAPPIDGVCIFEHERHAPILGREHGRPGRAREVNASVQSRPVRALGKPSALTLHGSAAGHW